MGVKWKTVANHIPAMETRLDGIKQKKVIVGALSGEHAWLAGIHEWGANVKATKAQYLTVPVHPDAYGRKASSFPDLFCIKSKKGNLLLVKSEGDSIIPYYWLTKEIKIPERAFLRNGHDEHAERLITQTERMIPLVIAGKKSIDDMCNELGRQLSTAIKDYMGKTEPNNPITIAVKGSDTPLTGRTGGLVESITWEVKD